MSTKFQEPASKQHGPSPNLPCEIDHSPGALLSPQIDTFCACLSCPQCIEKRLNHCSALAACYYSPVALMPRTHPEYSHTYRPNSHPFSTVPSNFPSGYSPASQSVSVVIRNSPASGPTAQNSEETSGRTLPDVSQAGILTEDLYYAPMPVGGQNTGDGSVLMPTPTRGTKRCHETEDDSSRQHRRLTTKEEVALFDICNQNADTFGSRSNLCKWWQSVATEFQRTHQGRSYSWHSVRRKVELVTRQRIKFLEDQRTRSTPLQLLSKLALHLLSQFLLHPLDLTIRRM